MVPFSGQIIPQVSNIFLFTLQADFWKWRFKYLTMLIFVLVALWYEGNYGRGNSVSFITVSGDPFY